MGKSFDKIWASGQTGNNENTATGKDTMASEVSGNPAGFARRLTPLGVISVILAVGYFNGWHEYFTLSSLIKNREILQQMVADNLLFAVTAFMFAYMALVALSFPGASLLTIAGGLMFGGILGGLMTVFSATAGAVIIFLVARSSFGDFLQARAGPFVGRMIEGFQHDSFQYLLTIRLTPVFPFWVINIVPALLNMKLVPYAVATFLGIIPGTFAYAYIGAGLDSIVAAQQEVSPGCAEAGNCAIELKALITTEILIAMAGLAAISILPLVVRKVRGSKTGSGKKNSKD